MTPSFAVFEFLCFGLFIGCVVDSYKNGSLGFVLVAAVYGVLLEHLTVITLSFYEYGRFVIMIGKAPLAIGLAWSVIIYSAHRVATAKSHGPLRTAALATVLALTIDLGMDAIAMREGFWLWHTHGAWFGVPFLNFVAWSAVVFSFCFFYELLRSRSGAFLAATVALVLSLLILIPGDWLLLKYTRELHHILLFIAAMTACVLVVRKPLLVRVDRTRLAPALCLLVLHVFFLVLLLSRGYKTAGLVAVSAMTLLIALACHGTFERA